jgi:hypothetical protein
MMLHRPTLLLLLLPLLARAAPTAAPATTRAATRPAGDWCTKVSSSPIQPKPNQPVQITASVSPDVTAVQLAYQILDPGQYVELADKAYEKNWVTLDMQPGPLTRGRIPYSATLPGDIQKHRRLIRYRVVAQDAAGKSLLAPVIPAAEGRPIKPDRKADNSNFAYFVYDGVPAWTGAINPKGDARQKQPATFAPDALRRAQTYHLIARREAVENVQWKELQEGREYKYTAALVTPDGVAHDHVRFRARGGSRLALGKNMWKLGAAPGDRFAQWDDFGVRYKGGVTKINLSPAIQQAYYGRRGEQGLYEAVGFALFNLAGVEAPRTHFVHWRVIDDAAEAPADQYRGDFWGLYLANENIDGHFLKAHDLPNGNVFKMAGGGGELNNAGEGQPVDGSDLAAFQDAYNGKDQPEEWWRDNLDLPRYYSYRAIVECLHHYNIGEGKNYSFYRNPETKRWQTVPWDLDLTWADEMYGTGNEPFKARVLRKPAFDREFQNRLREVRDLLFNEEQTGALIDQYAKVLTDPGHERTSIVEADRRKWDFNPAFIGGGGNSDQGLFYQAAPTKDFPGMLQLMKAYVRSRGQWVDQNLLNDPKVPTTPTITRAPDALRFTPGDYKGANPFAAAQWRLAEITPASTQLPPRTPRLYEITPAWQSEEIPKLEPLALPPGLAKPDKPYRVRLRVKDATNRWSHWSAPTEFTTPAP